MELKGKKIAFLGDSITESYGASCVEKAYWNLIGQQTGAEVYGYGIGGTTISKRHSFQGEERTNRFFESRVDEMIPDADIVVVFGGTNDFGGCNTAFGHMTDRTHDTFCGSMHLLLLKLIEKYPAAQLVVMTPLHRSNEDDDIYDDFGERRAGKLSRYVEAIREIAGFYGIPVVDLHRICPIQPRIPSQRERYAPDGLHPNDAGHALVAQRLLGLLNTL